MRTYHMLVVPPLPEPRQKQQQLKRMCAVRRRIRTWQGKASCQGEGPSWCSKAVIGELDWLLEGVDVGVIWSFLCRRHWNLGEVISKDNIIICSYFSCDGMTNVKGALKNHHTFVLPPKHKSTISVFLNMIERKTKSNRVTPIHKCIFNNVCSY